MNPNFAELISRSKTAPETPEIQALELAIVACSQAVATLRVAQEARPDWQPIRLLGLSPRAARPLANRLGLTIVKRGRDLCLDRTAYLAAMAKQATMNAVKPAMAPGSP